MNKRQIQREGTLALIYQTVNDLAGEKSFQEIRIKDICARAGISVGAFYHHFSSKQDILFERYKATNDFYLGLFEDSRSMSPVDALKYVTTECIDYARTRVPDILINYMQALFTHRDEWIKRLKTPFSCTKLYTEILNRCAAEGALADSVSVDSAISILTLLQAGIVSKQCSSCGTYLRDCAPEIDALRLIDHSIIKHT